MTKGEQALLLREQGLSNAEIAEIMGIGVRAVSAHISTELLKRGLREPRKLKRSPCKWGDDCFKCPLPECRIKGSRALVANKLETDNGDITRTVEGRGVKRTKRRKEDIANAKKRTSRKKKAL